MEFDVQHSTIKYNFSISLFPGIIGFDGGYVCFPPVPCPDEFSFKSEGLKYFNPYIATRFLMFTRQNPTLGDFIQINDYEALDRSFFNETKPTKVIVHGLFNNETSKINKILVPAYLRNFDVNVLVVGWGTGANTPCYGWAVERSYRVGKVVAEFLDFLLGFDQDKWDQLTLVGHSIGAHICGFAGKRVRKGRVGTIVGLDPGKKMLLRCNIKKS